MTLTYFMGLLGGLALFLYGMQMMSTGLEASAGNKMKLILERLTANRMVGVLVGAMITAVIQSSSATTVMVVGFVNSKMMTLSQAVWIIMGANIGTTITGQLIALDVGAMAPLVAFLGVAAIVFSKNEKVKHFGEIIAGLGILFIGMDMMSTAMKPLADSEGFVNLLTRFENPILGILAGTVFTALIQSSSASVGILQALAGSGVIGLNSAAYVLFGQNIGTCITALLASVGTSRNAKRATTIHIMFNVFGTVIFTILCMTTPLTAIVESFTPGNAPAQIANLHTLFNIVTTLMLLPIGTWMTKLAIMLLKDNEEDSASGEMHVRYLLDLSRINVEKLGVTMICVEGIKKELNRMLDMAKENVNGSFDVFLKKDSEKFRKIDEREEYVDYLNKELTKYITTAATFDNTTNGSQIFNSLFSISGNIERISDHAMNIAEYSNLISEQKIVFSDKAKEELDAIKDISRELLSLLAEDPEDIIEWHEKVAFIEQRIDDMTDQYRSNLYERIKGNACTDESGVLFSEMLTDFERIGDHGLKISKDMVKIKLAEK